MGTNQPSIGGLGKPLCGHRMEDICERNKAFANDAELPAGVTHTSRIDHGGEFFRKLFGIAEAHPAR